MYKLILLLFLLIPSVAFSMSLYKLNGQCGKHVRVVSTFLSNPPAATYINDQGEFIVMDANFMRQQTDRAIWFVFFHECGHRVNKHSKWFNPPNKEDVADCYAAHRFVTTFGYSELKKTLLELQNEPGRDKRILSCLQ